MGAGAGEGVPGSNHGAPASPVSLAVLSLVSFDLENILLEFAWTGQIKPSLPQNCVTGIIELECSY